MSAARVIIVEGYSRSLVRANPSVLFAFDDNLARVGFVGQAEHCRNCLNAVGIPTKISPTQHLFDADVEQDMDRFKQPIIRAFAILRQHLRQGGAVAWPKEGVGTDEISRLYITGPRLLGTIEGLKDYVFDGYPVTHENHQS